jgi:putative sigma-54 modulation protein
MSTVLITGEHYDVDDVTRKYVIKKLSRLEKYLPRHARSSASAEVKLRQINESHGNKYEAEVIMHVPDKTLLAKDSTLNMLAAVDIVEAKLINQLHKYKETTARRAPRKRLFGRLRRAF